MEYTGGKPYTIYLADADKKALLATYDLAVLLSDVNQMSKEKDKATKKIEYLAGKLK